jgi:hypothetical protein
VPASAASPAAARPATATAAAVGRRQLLPADLPRPARARHAAGWTERPGLPRWPLHDKRLKAETAYDGALDDADSVSVVGKFAPHAKWIKDEDGTPVTTIRAKRVTITG